IQGGRTGMATAGLAATEAPPGRIPRPELSAEQKRLILEATAELIRATVEGRTPQFADPKLGGATAKTVAGAFVSLKRGKHLRACCGGLQQRAVPLGKALYEAALRTALEDARFPPISPTEV